MKYLSLSLYIYIYIYIYKKNVKSLEIHSIFPYIESIYVIERYIHKQFYVEIGTHILYALIFNHYAITKQGLMVKNPR